MSWVAEIRSEAASRSSSLLSRNKYWKRKNDFIQLRCMNHHRFQNKPGVYLVHAEIFIIRKYIYGKFVN